MRTETVAQRWGRQGRSIRTASLSFDGYTLYSYREPIAHIFLAEEVTLVSSRYWSQTTSRHQSLARRYAPWMAINVPVVCPGSVSDHQRNQEYLLGSYREALAKARRAREAYQREAKLERAQELGLQALRYAAVFHLAPPAISPDIDVTEIERQVIPEDSSVQTTLFNP